MSTDQSSSTGDLRSRAVEYQRDHEKKHKWAHGQAWGPGRRVEDGHPRPARASYNELPGIRRDGVATSSHKVRARKSAKDDIQEHMSSDCSADEDVDAPSAAPAPDADITYSYDAVRGPGHGSQVLGIALDKAIERYEVRATDKLIKDEYEVLGSDGEPVNKETAGKSKKSLQDVEDDFELV